MRNVVDYQFLIQYEIRHFNQETYPVTKIQHHQVLVFLQNSHNFTQFFIFFSFLEFLIDFHHEELKYLLRFLFNDALNLILILSN